MSELPSTSTRIAPSRLGDVHGRVGAHGAGHGPGAPLVELARAGPGDLGDQVALVRHQSSGVGTTRTGTSER